MKKIIIFDTTLRDGEQTPGASLKTIEKVTIAKALEKLGVDVIEAGFPVSSPSDFESVRQISQIVKNSTICGLTRALPQDIDTCYQALKKAQNPRIHTGIGVSDIHIKYKLKSTREKILSQAVTAVKYAKKYLKDIEFYAEDAGRADKNFLTKIIKEVIKAGAVTVNIPDTTGYCLPEQFGSLIKYINNHVANINKARIAVHCHNDLGLATANTLSAITNGAKQAEVTINGVGERAGNASLEEVVMALKMKKDFFKAKTDINTRQITKTSMLVSKLLNMPVQKNKAIVGENAFSHSSGIHQDGILKKRQTYEIINPKDIGIDESKIVLTSRSGRHALKHTLERLEIKLEAQKLDQFYQAFLKLADQKKQVYDADLINLLNENKKACRLKTYSLKKIKVVCGNLITPSANAELIGPNKKILKSSAKGNGPISAAFKAIDKIIKRKIILLEYLVQAITKGKLANAEVSVLISYQNKKYFGKGIDSDIVVASVKAYLNAINKTYLKS